jgi:hypothetical protein
MSSSSRVVVSSLAWGAIIITTGVIGVCVTSLLLKTRKRESFKVVGTIGPYKDLYYKCQSDCERSDPGKQLSPAHGNLMCDRYCDSVITDLTRRGGPSYPLDVPTMSTANNAFPPYDIRNLGSGGVERSIDQSFKICGDGEANAWCREKFFTASEIDAKCQQDCQYSTYPTKQCMTLCAASKAGNYSLGWSWK